MQRAPAARHQGLTLRGATAAPSGRTFHSMAHISLLISDGARALHTSAGPSRARRRGGGLGPADRPRPVDRLPAGTAHLPLAQARRLPRHRRLPRGTPRRLLVGLRPPAALPVAPTTDPDGFIARVAEICRTHRVDAVVPLDEDIVRLIAERGAEIGDVVVVGPNAHQYHTLCDKVELTRTAQALGLDTPHTVVVDENGPDGPWPTLPSIVKPRTSRSETVRPRMVMTEAERDEYVDELVETGIGAVVQERIDGPRWLVQSVRGPGVFEYVAFRVLDEWPRGAGPASYKRNVEAPPTLVAAARALLDHVDYNGPSGISFMESDGRFYPHDANLRLGASSPASPHAGFDFPRRAVEAVLELGRHPVLGPLAPRPVHAARPRAGGPRRAPGARRKEGGAPGAILRRILSVGLSRQGMLDPSPFDPFWVGQLLARVGRKAGRKARSTLRPH